MNNSIARLDVRACNLSLVDEHPAYGQGCCDAVALHSLNLLPVLDIFCEYRTRGNVVFQNLLQLVSVSGLEEAVQGAVRQLLEGGVGGGKNGEGATARQGIDEVAGLERGDERGELRRGSGHVDDGFM